MKRLIVAGIIVVVVASVAYVILQPQNAFLGPSSAAADGPTETPPVLPAVTADPRILAEAKVVPLREASLSAPTGGTVSNVLVQEGDQVEAGQILLQLSHAQQKAAVAQAEATLQGAKARLAELSQGPRPQEIEAAQAAVEGSQANLSRLLENPRPEDIAVAEAGVVSAQATLAKVLEGSRQEDVTAARAEMASAEALLQQAQADYDKLGWRNDRPALSASLELERATNAFIAAKGRYEALARGATDAELAAAQAGVQRAQAELARAKAPTSDNDIAAARSEVRRAEAQLELLRAGPRKEQIMGAEADVAAAQAALDQASAVLEETELRAPFPGTVVTVEAELGEAVSPSTPLVRLADLSEWYIDTEDLTEIQVVDIQAGDSAIISFDAMAELELPGRVVRIRAMGESKQGDMTYTVRVQPEAYDQRMRWNMTTVVAIEPNSVDR